MPVLYDLRWNISHQKILIFTGKRCIPLNVIQLGAFEQGICAIKDLVGRADQSDRLAPDIHLVGPIVVSLVLRKSSEAGGQIEEGSLRDRVLVTVSAVERGDLPACVSLLVQSL